MPSDRCGYLTGDARIPVAYSSGYGCVLWDSPAVFGCTSSSSTVLATRCVGAGEQALEATAGLTSCESEKPHCATVSLQWRGYWYQHYECRGLVNEEIVLLAMPTSTGAGATSTINLEEAFPAAARSASTSWPSFTSMTTPAAAASTSWPSFTSVATSTVSNTSTGGGGGSGLDGTAKTAIGIISSVVVAVVAVVGLWYAKCAKRNSSRMRNLEERRLSHEIRRDSPSASRSLVLQRPGGVTMPGRTWGGQGLNMYVNEFHYHDHGAGRS